MSRKSQACFGISAPSPESCPGSLSGGPSTGILWPDTNDLTITNISQIEEWFNSRLFEGQGRLTLLQPCDLVLCHLDIAPRNIIWKEDHNSICLLDWASAGFYPRVFEHISQCIKEEAFNGMVIRAMDPMSKIETVQKEILCQAVYNNQRFLFRRIDPDQEVLYKGPTSRIFPLPPPPPPPSTVALLQT